MGLDISLYKIIDFDQEKIDNNKARLFNVNTHGFNIDVTKKWFIYAEDEFDYSSIPIGSKILEEGWIERTYDENNIKYESFIRYLTPDGKENTLFNIPIKPVYNYYILAEEIGYQRKGANKDFYLDGMWSSEPICTLDLLKRHHKKYFSGQKGGKRQRLKENATVEYLEMTNKELSDRFKENILSKFIEGETFVIYH